MVALQFPELRTAGLRPPADDHLAHGARSRPHILLAGTGAREQIDAADGEEDGVPSLRDVSYVAVVENRCASLRMNERPKLGSYKAARIGGLWVETVGVE